MQDESIPSVPTGTPLKVLGYPVNGLPDELALGMLQRASRQLPLAFEISSARVLASELVTLVKTNGYDVVCLADLPPSAPSKTRYVVKKLRAALPELRLAVGRWAPPELADESLQPLTDAGASHVAVSILDTRRYLAEAAHVGTPSAEPDSSPEVSTNAAA